METNVDNDDVPFDVPDGDNSDISKEPIVADTNTALVEYGDFSPELDEIQYNYEDREAAEFDYLEPDHEESEVIIIPELKQKSQRSLFDYKLVSEEDQEVEEEEPDLTDVHTPLRYDLSRYGYEALKEEERREIIGKLQELTIEFKVLQIVNNFLHKNYLNVIRNSSSFSSARDRFDESLIFEDTRYQATLENYGQIKYDVEEKSSTLTAQSHGLKDNYDLAKSQFEENFGNLMYLQEAVAKRSKPLKSDSESWEKLVEGLLETQRVRMGEMAKIRLVHVRLQMQLDKEVAKLKAIDCLGPQFSMYEYEYLLKRKDVYSEKRDEQVECMKRLYEKNLSTAGAIRHINEEVDLYNEKVKSESNNLSSMKKENDVQYAKLVDLVKERASTFKNIMKEREKIGLLDNPFLLNKMEFDWKKTKKLAARVQSLKSKISEGKRRLSIYY